MDKLEQWAERYRATAPKGATITIARTRMVSPFTIEHGGKRRVASLMQLETLVNRQEAGA